MDDDPDVSTVYRLHLELGGFRSSASWGRVAFAIATQLFIVLFAGPVAAGDGDAGPARSIPVLPSHQSGCRFRSEGRSFIGVEARSDAIAQLPQLDDRARRRFGRWTLCLTIGIVGALTVGFATAAVRLGVGLPRKDSTL